MKDRIRALGVTITLAIAGLASPARAGDVDINVNLGGVPPPPAVVFEREPPVVLVPETRVYYLPGAADYDFYRYRTYWYVNRGGFWYRAKSYRGPFLPVEIVRVPQVIIGLPVKYRKHPAHPHGGPPGQLKKMGVPQGGPGRGKKGKRK